MPLGNRDIKVKDLVSYRDKLYEVDSIINNSWGDEIYIGSCMLRTNPLMRISLDKVFWNDELKVWEIPASVKGKRERCR